ncbi:MAG: phage tail tape measure protein [Desulforhopalus sp.]
MATQLQKLMFSVGLLDKVTGPAGRIQKKLRSVAGTAQESFARIAGGAAGVASSGYALNSLVTPAHELNLAIGEVRSLDVAKNSLDALSNEAIKFSIRYGDSASSVVSSAYDIQSAIAGLVGKELANFTIASGVLAKGTKSDAATITNYMGTMYGIFKNSADSMGKSQWVEQLTGQTATAVQMFKTTGGEMASAFSSIGAEATAAGIAQSEQMAVLGTLQATMSGSEAGTKYKAFLNGVGDAQDKLGLKLTDSNGQMLGMTDILGKLQGKFGSTFDVAESDALKKAFGSDEAVSMIKLLIADTTGLAKSINTIGKVTGMKKAKDMAASMVDPFQRWNQGVQAVKTGLGQALLPVLYPLAEKMAEGAGLIYNWTQRFPTLTKYIGYAVIGITALVAIFSVFAIVGGMAAMATGGLSIALAILTSPITLTVLLIGALIAGVVAVIYYWDDLKASFADNAWATAIMGWIEKIVGKFKSLGGVFDWVGDKLSWVPGMGGDGENEVPSSSPRLAASRRADVLPGGVSRSVANAVTNNSRSDSRSVHIGQITTSRPLNMQEINNMALLGGA